MKFPALLTLLFIAVLIAAALCVSGCVHARSGDSRFTAFGGQAQGVKIGGQSDIDIASVDNEQSFKDGSDAITKGWTRWLTKEVIETLSALRIRAKEIDAATQASSEATAAALESQQIEAATEAAALEAAAQ